MITINLDYLKSFFVIVESNSISKAAEKLHLTQPGLSMQLKNLENDVGAKLLNRSNKGVQLTSAGKVVYEQAKAILSVEKNMMNSIKNLQNNKNILSVSACKSLGEYALPCSIYTFKEIYPDLDVNLRVDNTCNVITQLKNHETDIAIITGKHESETIESIPILEDKLVLVSSLDSEYDEIDLKQLEQLPLITRDSSSATRLLLTQFLEKNGMKFTHLNVILSVNSPESIKSTLISGRGYAFLPEIVIRQELKRKLIKKIKIKDFDTTFQYHFAYRKDYKLNEIEKKFKKYVTSDKRCFCH